MLAFFFGCIFGAVYSGCINIMDWMVQSDVYSYLQGLSLRVVTLLQYCQQVIGLVSWSDA